jgi:hypothetical protein
MDRSDLACHIPTILFCLIGCSSSLGGSQSISSEVDGGSTTEGCLEEDKTLWYLDSDGDGFGEPTTATKACEQPAGRVSNGGDCDDQDVGVNPSAIEVCGDKRDNNCTGSDECQVALVGHWDFQEVIGNNVVDASGNGRHITLRNGSTVTSESFIHFDGIDDYAEVLHDASFALADGTISMWVLTNLALTRQGLWSKDSNGLDAGGHLQIELLDDDTIRVRLQSQSESKFVASAPITQDTWHHIAFSFGQKGMRLYVDGSLAAFDPFAGGIQNNIEPIALGSNTSFSDDGVATPTSDPMSGDMADVRMYSRALDEEEVKDLHGQGLFSN